MKLRNILYIALLAITASSCMPYRNLQYIRDGNSSEYQNDRKSKTIRAFDALYVKVLSTDEKTAAIFTPETRSSNTSELYLVSYTVNEDGDILFPFVGKIRVKDLTLEAASEKIQSALSQYLLNTAVTVRFINNSVTVLGSVESEGDYSFTTDKLSLFQAIGLAGGISNYGNRENVTVIRVIDDKVTYNVVSLANKNIVESKFYYIEPNDVIVVKPLKSIRYTFSNNTFNTALTTISTLITVLLFIQN